jgi:uncharacterized protein YbjT (DUF2867 family)
MKPTILVTGATGTVGRHVVAELTARGLAVGAMSSRAGATPPGTPHGACIQADWRVPDSLRRAFDGVRALFLLLPLAPDMPALAHAAVDAARAAGVRHVVRLSAIGADAASDNAFARLQGELDATLSGSGLGWTLLRAAGFMQNYVTYGAGMIRGGCYLAAHGDAAQPLVDAADLGACAAAVLADPAPHAGAVYVPTGARCWTHAEAMAEISRAIGREVAYLAVDDAAAQAALQGMGMPEPLRGWMLALNELVRSGRTGGATADVQRLTGRAPGSFEDFVRAHADAWR